MNIKRIRKHKNCRSNGSFLHVEKVKKLTGFTAGGGTAVPHSQIFPVGGGTTVPHSQRVDLRKLKVFSLKYWKKLIHILKEEGMRDFLMPAISIQSIQHFAVKQNTTLIFRKI